MSASTCTESTHRARAAIAFALVSSALVAPLATAGDGRLLASGGAHTVDGAAGGGLASWAVLAGYSTRGESGASAFATHVQTSAYRLDVAGVAVTFDNRVELSLARQRFDLGPVAAALSLADPHLEQDVAGAKLRIAGDLVYGAMPQLAIGLQHRRHRDFGVPAALGARHAEDTELYLAASKLHLAAVGGHNLLWSLALRRSRANELGLLGYGGDDGDSHAWLAEGSIALLLSPGFAIGAEYRQKPDLLAAVPEDDWQDLFVAWFPNKRVAAVAAWVELGHVGGLARQHGPYLSLQVAF